MQKRLVLVCEGSLCLRKLSDVSRSDLGEAGRERERVRETGCLSWSSARQWYAGTPLLSTAGNGGAAAASPPQAAREAPLPTRCQYVVRWFMATQRDICLQWLKWQMLHDQNKA